MNAKLIPELDVSNLDLSLKFYTEVIGFKIKYDRPEEKFVFLTLEDVSIMLQEADGPGRRFRTAPLEKPFGRGINLQIEISNIDSIFNRVIESNSKLVIPLERKWYRKDTYEVGNKQFVVSDPDGYLLRFFSDMGERVVG